MVQIEGFAGIRYDLGHVGALSDVIAPPYDVIDEAMRDQLYKQHPANVVRLILNRAEPGDASDDDRYKRAARYFKQWQREGVLLEEVDPAVYVYHQLFEYEGQQFTRRGFMGRLRLEPFGEGQVYPHEQTHAAAKADRLRLTQACQANLSQIFAIYPDAENNAQRILETAIEGDTPLEAVDHLGVTHRIWPVMDPLVISELQAVMGPQPAYVADGHHRYETACNYRQYLVAEQGELPSNHPANGIMSMFVSMQDAGMIVLPTHRLLTGMPAFSSSQLTAAASACFDLEELATGPAAADEVWQQIELEGAQGVLGLYCPADERWLLARINDQGREKMAEVAEGQSSEWQGLGVSILHRLLIDTLLAARDLPKPDYVHLVDEVVAGLKQGDSDGRPYGLAALVMPATLDHIREISHQGERMPAKSTYFYPKLLSGLVFHRLDG